MSLLRRNVESNGYGNVVPVLAAVSRGSGKQCLYTDRANLAAASLAERNLPESRSTLHEVESLCLDDFFQNERIDLLKMDTQGSEGLIIEGAERVIRRDHPVIFTEFWPYGLENLHTDADALLETLLGFGYSVKVIDEEARCLTPIQPSRLVSDCRREKEGRGYVNLLLEPLS